MPQLVPFYFINHATLHTHISMLFGLMIFMCVIVGILVFGLSFILNLPSIKSLTSKPSLTGLYDRKERDFGHFFIVVKCYCNGHISTHMTKKVTTTRNGENKINV